MDQRNLGQKRLQEQQLVSEMIRLYCHYHHHPQAQLCPQCEALDRYARDRSQHCPRMAEKTFCSCCPAPCYSPAMREQIRTVMRFSGPRMLFHHPVVALRHAAAVFQLRRHSHA